MQNTFTTLNSVGVTGIKSAVGTATKSMNDQVLTAPAYAAHGSATAVGLPV